jgi:hypothetical protein
VLKTRPRILHGATGWQYLKGLVATDAMFAKILTNLKAGGERHERADAVLKKDRKLADGRACRRLSRVFLENRGFHGSETETVRGGF